jgi:hypothetical protein
MEEPIQANGSNNGTAQEATTPEEFYYEEIHGMDKADIEAQKELDNEGGEEEEKKEEGSEKKNEKKEELGVNVQELLAKQKEELAKEFEEKAAKIQEEATKKVLEEIHGRATTPQVQKKYIVNRPWEIEGRNPKNWDEVATWSAQEALAQMKKEQQTVVQREEEETKQNQEQMETAKKQWNDYWNGQLKSLEESGRIPPVPVDIQKKLDSGEGLTDAERENPGVKARLDLFILSQETDNHSLIEVYHEHYKDKVAAKKKQPPGANAPISAGKGTPKVEGDEFYYEDIHGKTPAEIMGDF